jgi:hypothetical protein
MSAIIADVKYLVEGLLSTILFVAVIGVLLITYYALKRNNVVKAYFNCKLFIFSIETKRTPHNERKNLGRVTPTMLD